MCTSPHLQGAAKVFTNDESNPDEIGDASAEAFKVIYGGKMKHNLTRRRYSTYMDMFCKRIISPEKLLPTERTARFHGMRAHYQIMKWMSLDSRLQLNATDWGWEMKGDLLLPITSDFDVAPPELKKIIRCNCSISMKHPCSWKSCTCRKLGIPCVSACGNCRGNECTNSHERKQIENDDSEDMD